MMLDVLSAIGHDAVPGVRTAAAHQQPVLGSEIGSDVSLAFASVLAARTKTSTRRSVRLPVRRR